MSQGQTQTSPQAPGLRTPATPSPAETQKSIHAKLTSITRTANTCNYRITAKAAATAGDAAFTIPYTSSSGATLDARVTVKVSNIAYTAPSLSMAAGETLAVSAGSYASDGTFTITCANATSISTEFSSVTRTANTCNYSAAAKATASAGSASFTVPYTSSGGDTHNGQISITITAINYTAPTDLKVVAGANADVTASSWATHSGYTISCGAAKSIHTKLSSVTRPDAANKPCEYRVTAKAAATAGDATFTIPYTSSSGATLDAQVTVKVSNISYTAPTNLTMAAGETLAVTAANYASDGTFTITCANATSISTEFSSVTRTANTCNYSVIAKATAAAGSASFTVPYTSSGGDTHNGQISITITAISYTAPTNLKVAAGSNTDITASSWASHTGYTISCGAAKSIHTKLSSVTRPDAANKPCEYRVTAKAAATAGDATFTIPYASSSGATLDAQVTVKVSNIAYTAPSLSMAAGETLAVSAASYASDGAFTISCADATSISAQFTSVARTANTCNYSAAAKATASAGSASFTVPYTSSGGDTHNGVISITISTISYTAPTGLKVVAGSNADITTSTWASHTGYTITCGDAKSLHAKLSSVTRTANTCNYRITAKATAAAGDATFTIPYTSSSGATLDAQVTVKVSNIAYTAPSLSMAAGETLAVSAASYASDGTFTISCANATSISNQFTSVTRTANTCNYSVIAKVTAAAGSATFTVPYTSSGGDTHNGVISITISTISYTAPTNLKVVAGSNTDITASSWASHSGYTISCGAAKSIHAKLNSVTRPDADSKPCEYRITAKASATAGNATFTIPYTSSSGATLDAQVTVKVSNIAYTAPASLTMAAGETLAISAGGYASDGTFTITCANATSISTEFSSVTRTANTCNYSVIAKATASAGSASFTVPYTSSGGDTHNGVISITISTISYTAPAGLKVVAGSNTDVSASTWASHSGYTISCGDAKSVHAKLTSVTRTANTCNYRVTAKATATAGDATFTIPYTSSSGATLDAQVTVKVSNIAYTAPASLTMAAGETLAVSAASYATDGTFTISCANATSISAQFTSATRTANTCNYSVVAKATAAAGAATFTVPYTSSGGDTQNGQISITITTISYTAPTGLKVVAGSNTDITANTWASHTGYIITCGAAKSIHTKLTSVTRPDADSKPCEYRITAKAAATAGDATFTIPYTSSSGATLDAQVTVKVSNIAYTAPATLSMAAGETLAVSAANYATDGTFTITCADATSISTQFTSVTRTANTCNYSAAAKATASAGAATFTVPYTSSGGDTHNGQISITISTISYTAPTGLKVVAGSNTDITATSWASHSGYTISCGDAKSIHTKLSSVTRTANTCNYRVTAKATATAGDATFTIPYTSSSGATLDAQVTVKVSNIAYTAPTSLTMAAGETLAVSAASYATDGTFTISCADATSISAHFTSVTRTANTCNYSVVAKATAAAGAATFTVPYTSSGGDTHNGQISITISTISYTAPSGLKVVVGSNADITASTWASHTGYTITCGDAKSIHAKLTSITRTANTCNYRITAKATAAAGDATFTIPYTSSSGATLDAQITVKVSNIAYTAPSLSMAAGETLAVSAASYASDGTFTISCANATSISNQFTSVTRTANTCNYSVIAKATAAAGSATFTVPYTSSGGDTHNGVISITISTISYTAPTNLKVVAGSNTDITASTWASHTGYTVTCGAAKSVHAKLTSVTRPDADSKPCEYRITAKATAAAGDATFVIPYSSTSGATLDAQVTVKVSNIAFTAPNNLTMAAGETLAVSAGGYASDGAFTISCADATSISAQFTSVTRTANTCSYSAVAKATATAGTASFTVPYTSSGGDTHNGVISITISTISYTAPTNLKVVAGANTDITASSWATHTGYTITCGDAKSVHAKLTSVTRPDTANKPCEYRITAKATATAGDATFTIPYTSSSGATLDAQVTVKVSNIAYTAPSLSMAAGETLAVSAASYATDGTFTISCADATSISTEFSSVTRTANTCSYSAAAKATASAGSASFTVPYTSSGGDTHNGVISITISTISYTAPTGLKVVAGSNTDITATSWASHSSYTISCGDAKSIHTKLSSVTRTANTCNYRITAKAAATAGDATFTIPYTSSSGATLDAQVTVKVSNIAYTAPTTLSMAAGETLAVTASSYASDGTFTISCADATSISAQFTSVTRTANTCNYSAAAKATASAGAASFTVPYASSGGDTHNGVISITISTISYTAPTGLKVVAGSNTDITASSWASHTGYTISCGAAKNIHTKLTSVTRPDTANKPCEYRITAKATATAGDATFTIPYTSSSGATLDAQVTVKVSNIAYTAPSLSMAAGETLAVSAANYATDGTFTITCADATSISTQFTSVTRTANTCNYSAAAKATASAGAATFTVPYTSSGGDTHNGVISITISTISYTAPTGLKVVAGSNTDITASTWASHTGYTISCGDAKSIHAKLSSVTRTANTCNYRITAKATATAGDATFTIPYTSTSGATLDAQVTVKVSNIAYTAPTNLTMAAGETLAVSAANYATDGAFTISCADATSISTQFTSITRTANTCNYSVVAKATASAGSASFTVPYTSRGGDTHNGVISITISTISYTAPTGLRVVAGSNTDITASSWASHTGYTISCGAAKSIHAKLTSVTRPDADTKPCEYRITAKTAAAAGDATFTIPYTSSSGATLDAQVTVKVSNIAYTAPTSLTMAAGETLAVSAANYATDGTFTISCADATSISAHFTSVTRTANTCNYSAAAKATASAGSASFTVPYTSSGGDTHNGVISITISTISYTAPTGLRVVAGSNTDITASSWASHTGYTISCGAAKSIHAKLTSVTRPDADTKPCEYRITAKTTATAGDATFTIPYTSSSGATLDAQVTVKVSNIAYTAPSLSMAAGETLAISAASYASDGTFTITCANATSISAQFTSVTRTANTCNYSAIAKATAAAGAASFTVPYTSSGGDTHNGQISITISTISYTAPTGLRVVAGSNTDITASSWASHTGYTISCGAAKSIHAKLTSVTRPDADTKPCEYRITAKATATAGDATFTIPYTSSSGATLDAQVTVKVSNIAYTAPSLSMAAGETLAISAGGYASDGTFTISCADATNISAQFTSVTRTANTCNYSAAAKATASAGAASFTVPYTSSGGDTHNGVVSITISAISYTAPSNLKVVAGGNTDITASSWASHTGYTVSCGAAKSIHAKLTSVTRPDAATKPCEYRITAKAAATAGDATFTIPYTSTSGATLDARVTVKVSNIAYTAPSLSMAAGETLAVSAAGYATDGTFSISCADATSISTQFTSVTRTANTCNYSAVAKATAAAGSASFTVPYTSSGGDTHNGVISITISAISYTAPTNLKVVAGSNTDITASSWATHTGYTISCGDAKSIHAKLSSVTRTANTCNYRITAKTTATAGDATFTIPYTSTSGATLDAQVTVKVSNIAYTAPTNLTMAAGETLAVSAANYATDGAFTISCADATSISTQFTSVTRTANTCNYSAVAKATAAAGSASFTVPYTSSGGDTHNGVISITISAISYTAPTNLKVVAGSNTDITASTWASHTGYTITCGDAKSVHAKLTSVTRPDVDTKPCEYRITAKATATAGDATFTIPYASSSGATLDAQVTVKVSNIAYTAPSLSMAAGETLAVSAANYATDGAFTISCADATSISNQFTSVTRTANTCNYSVIAKATATTGAATFTVPYTSSGGDTHSGVISISISTISYTALSNLKVVAGSNTDVSASSWASHSGYTISCGNAKSVHAKLSSVTRTANTCNYRITAKAAATAGDATFTIPYTSSSGATLDAQVTIKISNIAYTAPNNLTMAAGETLAISAANYASDGTFTITCADATSISAQFTSVTRTANTCNYSAVAKATASAGSASFTVPFTSSGGDTHNGVISITITAISYTAPTDLKVVAGSNTDIAASSWASHTGYTISCGDAKSVHTKLTSVTRTANTCNFRVTAKATATAGDATFTIPYASSSGATLDAQVTVKVSNIAFTAPNNLTMAAGETLAVTASSYASDGTFTITCADATSISNQFTSVARTAKHLQLQRHSQSHRFCWFCQLHRPIHLIRRRHPQRHHLHHHHRHQLHRTHRPESSRRLKHRHRRRQLGFAFGLHDLLQRCEKRPRQAVFGHQNSQHLQLPNHSQSYSNGRRCYFHYPLHQLIGRDLGRAGNSQGLQHRIHSPHQPHHGSRPNTSNNSRQLRI